MPESTNITSRNFLSPLNYRFLLKRAPAVNFFVQKVNIPSLSSTGDAKVPTPLRNYPIIGNDLAFGPLNITFKVDEALQNYLEIHNWLRGIDSPDTSEQYHALEKNPPYSGEGLMSDIIVSILNSAKETIYEVHYIDCFPNSLSGFTMNSTDTEVSYITCDASFRYTEFNINPYKRA